MAKTLLKIVMVVACSIATINSSLTADLRCDGGSEVSELRNNPSVDECCTFCETNRVVN
jgi:hypothetical protein